MLCMLSLLCLVPPELNIYLTCFIMLECWVLVQGALVMPLMSTGFSMGLVKFNLITGVKS